MTVGIDGSNHLAYPPCPDHVRSERLAITPNNSVSVMASNNSGPPSAPSARAKRSPKRTQTSVITLAMCSTIDVGPHFTIADAALEGVPEKAAKGLGAAHEHVAVSGQHQLALAGKQTAEHFATARELEGRTPESPRRLCAALGVTRLRLGRHHGAPLGRSDARPRPRRGASCLRK